MSEHVEPTGRCPACGRGVYGGADFCKARTCPHYAPIWARDQQRKVFENLGAYSQAGAPATMLTVTGPGSAELPWDEAYCTRLGEHRCSGLLGCRVRADVAKSWNASASERWRRLHDRAATLAAREHGHRPLMLARAFEMQTRGVLHVHAVVGRGTGLQKRACDAYEAQLRRLAPRYGFGHVDTPTGRARSAREAAAYISSYLSRGKGTKLQLGETVRSQELPRSVIHVAVKLTMETGVTMRALRFRRLVYSRWGVVMPYAEQRNVMHLVEAFPGCVLERGPPA